MSLKYFDSHVHSSFSHDARSSVQEMCQQAETIGLLGMALTDHYDPDEETNYKHIKQSVEAVEKLREQVPFQLLRGVEIGDGVEHKKAWDHLISQIEFDVVLASIHTLFTGEKIVAGYRGWKGLVNFDQEQIQLFLTNYYHNVRDVVEQMDFDVLTHLTLPLRYFNGAFHRGVTLERQMEQIERILIELIRQGKALEVNTSGVETTWGEVMPSRELLALYYRLGGRKITLGSDAHQKDRLGAGLKQGATIAKEIGFTHYSYYEHRKAVEVALD